MPHYTRQVRQFFVLLKPSFLFTVFTTAVVLLSITAQASNHPGTNNNGYLVGAGIYDITGEAAESNMYGFVNMLSTRGIQQRLFSRAFIIADPQNPNNRIVFVSADLGAIFQSVKLAVTARLQETYNGLYSADNVMLTATHSHVASGGTSHYPLHIMASFDKTLSGYSPQNFKAQVDGIYESIVKAHNNLAPGNVDFAEGELTDATVNRSLAAYKENVDKDKFEHTINPMMVQLTFSRPGGKSIGLINWFAVHNTSLSKKYQLLSGDNKGFAQYLFESDKHADHRHEETFVAAFANSDEGDVLPVEGNAVSLPDFIGSQDELLNAERSGQRQYDKAIELYHGETERLKGNLNYKHVWQSMPQMPIRAEFGGGEPRVLCESTRGLAFIAGTKNGPSHIPGVREGMNIHNTGKGVIGSFGKGEIIAGMLQLFSKAIWLSRDDPCQHDKITLMSTGRLDWVPQVLPFQIFTVGKLAIIGAPSEVTTMAGRRIRQTVLDALKEKGIETALIAGLANTYSGYLTTREEYHTQQYEGASNEFGPYSLSAYRQIYHDLSKAIINNTELASTTPPDKTNGRRPNQRSVKFDSKRLSEKWGQVFVEPKPSYTQGEVISASFLGGHPKNNLRTQQSFLIVQRKINGEWEDYLHDWDWNTEYHWRRDGPTRSYITIKWRTSDTTPLGEYRIQHIGDRKIFKVKEYKGTSKPFRIVSKTNQL